MWPHPGASPWTSTSGNPNYYDQYGHPHAPYGLSCATASQFSPDDEHPTHMDERFSGTSQRVPVHLHSSPSSFRTRTAHQDHTFHPYRIAATAPTSESITFVDASQQAEAASKGVGPDELQQCKPKRKRILPDQLECLLDVFKKTDSPSYDTRERLSAETGMTNREVQVWFQNRRAKVNRQRLASVAAEEASQAVTLPNRPVLQAESSRASPGAQAAGQHQWKFRAGTALPAPASVPSAYQPSPVIPSPPPAPHPVIHGVPGYAYPYSPPGYTTYPSAPSPFYPANPYTGPSPFGPAAGSSTSFGGQITPPLSVETPSLASPGSASVSSYFPFTPSELSSPLGTFGRLALESPHAAQLRSPLSPGAAVLLYDSALSPDTDGSEPRIHLPPIRSDGPWDAKRPPAFPVGRPAHRRSISDSAAVTAAMLPAPGRESVVPRAALVRLSSLRGLLNDDDDGTEPATIRGVSAYLPTSPVECIPPVPVSIHDRTRETLTTTRAPSVTAASLKRPSLVSHYSTYDIHAPPRRSRSCVNSRMRSPAPTAADAAGSGGGQLKRGTAASPEQAARSLKASGGSEPAFAPESRPQRIGLGMLVAAASELKANDDEKVARLAAVKGMA